MTELKSDILYNHGTAFTMVTRWCHLNAVGVPLRAPRRPPPTPTSCSLRAAVLTQSVLSQMQHRDEKNLWMRLTEKMREAKSLRGRGPRGRPAGPPWAGRPSHKHRRDICYLSLRLLKNSGSRWEEYERRMSSKCFSHIEKSFIDNGFESAAEFLDSRVTGTRCSKWLQRNMWGLVCKKCVLCIVISLIKNILRFFFFFLLMCLPLLGEKIEGLLGFSVASFSPKGTCAEPGLVTIRAGVETIELLCVLSSVTRGTAFRGLCDRICSCLALSRPDEICSDAEEKLIRRPKNTGFFDIVLVRPSPPYNKYCSSDFFSFSQFLRTFISIVFCMCVVWLQPLVSRYESITPGAAHYK